MDSSKLQVVRTYLHDKFPQSEIEEKHDFDLGAQTFKIHKKSHSLLLKVGGNFIGDNSEEQIKNTLENQKISKILEENKELGILVTDEPPVLFNRD